jgi:hypothetical protein
LSVVAFLETHAGTDDPHHPQQMGRQAPVLHPQGPIAGTETRLTALAGEIGSVQGQAAQHAEYDLLTTPCVPSSRGASRTGHNGAQVIRVVGVQPLHDRDAGQTQRRATRGQFDGLEVPLFDRLTDQGVYLRDDFRAEGFLEAPFLAAS